MVRRQVGGDNIGLISRDRRFVALVKARSTLDTDLLLHDRTTGRTTNITPHRGNVNSNPVDFSPDSSLLVFTSSRSVRYSCPMNTGRFR
jgi:Tol biopolymer transport system component